MVSLQDLDVYKAGMEIGQIVWDIVCTWDSFTKQTLGKQLTRAADSIALNVAEGYGRFHFRENLNFCYYSRGSAFEAACILSKAVSRKLISTEQYSSLQGKFERYLMLINGYIRSIRQLNERSMYPR